MITKLEKSLFYGQTAKIEPGTAGVQVISVWIKILFRGLRFLRHWDEAAMGIVGKAKVTECRLL